jgi:hypothetical protein
VVKQFKVEKTVIRDFTKMLRKTNLTRLENFLNDYSAMIKLELKRSEKKMFDLL